MLSFAASEEGSPVGTGVPWQVSWKLSSWRLTRSFGFTIGDGFSSMGRRGLQMGRGGYKESRKVIPADKEAHGRRFPFWHSLANAFL